MDSKEKIAKLKEILGLEQSVKLEQMPLANGTVIEAETFEQGSEVFIIQDDNRIALPVGEYDLENGNKLIVEEEGKISEIKEEESEDEEVDFVKMEDFNQLLEVVEKLSEKIESMSGKKSEKKEVDATKEETKVVEDKDSKEKVEASKETKTETPKEEKKETVEASKEDKAVKHTPKTDVKKGNLFNLNKEKMNSNVQDRVNSILFG